VSRARAALALGLFLAIGPGCKNITAGRPAAGAVGAECKADAECREGGEPVCLAMVGGYCSVSCGAQGGDDCSGEAVCDALDTHSRYCLDGCLIRNGNDDCRAGYRCAERPDVSNLDGESVGVCLPACRVDTDCESGRRCDAETGSCRLPGLRAVGEPCLRAEECSGALCALGAGFVGGMCSARCGPADSPCPETALCVAAGANPMCLRPCTGDADCRADEGYRCRGVSGVSVCLPGCRTHADCSPEEHCEIRTGQCAAGAPRGAVLGGACRADGDCRLGTCATDWPGGACSYPCPCPDDTSVACARSRVADRCVAPCAADTDCRAGYLCEDAACQPPCLADADCGAGRVCAVATGHCGASAPASTTSTWTTLAERLPVGAEPSAELTLDVPEGALGVALVVDGQDDDVLVLADLRDPDGRALFDYVDPLRSAARFFPADQTVSAVLPVTPDTTPRAGRYRFRFIKDGPTRFVRVRASIKTSNRAEAPATARLDANIVFVGVDGLTAASAPRDAAFKAVLSELNTLFALAGVTLGELRMCDLPVADAARLSIIDTTEGPDNELSRLFELSGQAERWGCRAAPSLTWFLVDEIQGGRDGYTILGVAGGIPGPPALAGTGHSGVAVTMAGYTRQARRVALTMAHEAGHYLGLFHTTEAEATLFDPLTDTPQCERPRDDNGDGLLDYGECRGVGAENLMFWAAGGVEDISPHQGFVMRRNPGLR
jgi:hypothetical protein